MNENILNFVKQKTQLTTLDQIATQLTTECWIRLIEEYHIHETLRKDALFYNEQINF